jgi:murein DD-endopeptidase MepM/ murein hydrolase activator NlpD
VPLPSLDITSAYGPRLGVVEGDTWHYGTDLRAPRGTPIHALTGGRVILAGEYGSGGNTVIIQDPQGREWFYHHMNEMPSVRKGQAVAPGAQLGAVGQSGVATGPHLHIGLQVQGRWYDPTPYIRRAFRS